VSRARISRWAGRTVLAGLCWLAVAAVSVLVDLRSSVTVALALPGAACTVFMGKAFGLLPSYFARTLEPVWAPQFTGIFAVLGVLGLALSPMPDVPAEMGVLGAALWLCAVLVWAGSLAWTARDNLTGRETGTGEANEDRQPLDRFANAAAPIAVLYLLAGAVFLLGVQADILRVVGRQAVVAHLLGAGGAALAIFAVGFRLYPRFLVAHPPRLLPRLVLPAGAVGPVLLAFGVTGRQWALHAGAGLEFVAILGFAVAYSATFWRSDRRRIGLYGPLIGILLALTAAVLAVLVVTGLGSRGLIPIHRRFMLIGFLGTTIAGTAIQFYPPAVGSLWLSTDRTAAVALAAIGGGTAVNGAGLSLDSQLLAMSGGAVTVIGATLIPLLVGATLLERRT
jgi:hypothetical protein